MAAEEEKVVEPGKEEAQAKEKAPGKGSGKMGIIVAVVLAVVGVVLAGGISFFVAAKVAEKNSGPITVIHVREPGQMLKIGDPKDGVIVNIGGVTGRYLKIVMTVEVEPTKDAKGVSVITEQDRLKIDDGVIRFLRSQKIDAFTADRQDELKDTIKKYVNELLGNDRIMAVYITNAVIQ